VGVLSLRMLLARASERELHTVYSCWRDGGRPPTRRQKAVSELAAVMSDEERVEERLKSLPKKLSDLLELFTTAPSHECTLPQVQDALRSNFPSRADVEAQLAALQREGFLLVRDRRSAFALPAELAECIAQLRQRRRGEIERVVTLRGFLNWRYFDSKQRQGDPDERADDHADKVYKIYLMGSSIRGRVRSLPPAVRRVWDVVLGRYGGVMPVADLASALGEDEPVDLELLAKCLEEAMLGTVAPLRLARLGMRPSPAAIIVFHEIAVHCLQQRSDRDQVDVEQALSSGVDTVSSVGRFLRELDRSKVQFTLDGDLYKASEKRISKCLLAVPGGYLDGPAQIRFIYRFCLARRLVDRSGERALRPTDAGRQFEQLELRDKLMALLSYSVEERELPGEPYHHARLRRGVLRLLRRLEPERWYEAMYLPFLARNGYLSKLDSNAVEDVFAARFQTGGYLPGEDLQQVSRNLLLFIKRRLYPLGIVDLGVREGRPVAIRLSRLGAEVLGAGSSSAVGGERSEVVVNPDFEIILFPGEDEHEVVHSFDRFAERHKTDHIYHFRLSQDSVSCALDEGVTMAEITAELADRSRTPLPQNVRYSLEEWASNSQAKPTR